MIPIYITVVSVKGTKISQCHLDTLRLQGSLFSLYLQTGPELICNSWILDKKPYDTTVAYEQCISPPPPPPPPLQPKKLVFSNLTHLRRRRPGDSTDYICPLDSSLPASMPPASSIPSSVASSISSVSSSAVSQPAANGTQGPSYAAFRGLSPILDREPGPHSAQQVGPDDS